MSIFLLLLNRAYTEPRISLFFTLPSAVSNLGVDKRLEGDKSKRADPKWSKRFEIKLGEFF